MSKSREKDVLSNKYIAPPERYAQVVNNELFDGRQVVDPEGLEELDSQVLHTMGLSPEEIKVLWKNRDLLRIYKRKALFLILGIENQTNVHYCMPLRMAVYDVMEYEKQRREISRKHREQGDLSSDEFISGFSKKDRFLPVFSVVMYWGVKEWDGAKKLSDLLDIPADMEQYKDKLFDYRMNLLDIPRMENLDAYSGEVKALFGFIRYQKDKVGLAEFVEKNQELFRSISPETVQAISVMGNAREVEKYVEKYAVTEENGEECVDMCKALEDMMADARRDGYDKGEQSGYLKGEQSGQRTGQLQAKQDIAVNLSQMGLSIEQIAAAVEQSVGVITKWLENGPMLAK